MDMARGRYLRLGRPVNEYDWLCLLSMAHDQTVATPVEPEASVRRALVGIPEALWVEGTVKT